MRRPLYGEEHEAFRATARQFFAAELGQHLADWTEAGRPDRGFFERAGALGMLGLRMPEAYGGAGLETYSFNVVLNEAAAAEHLSTACFRLHAEIFLPYLVTYGSDEQKRRWLPDLIAGRRIGALAMSESATGSDLAGITTRAVRDGDHYRLTGSKTFITNGTNADLVIVVARTSQDAGDRRQGLTLLMVERGMTGFTSGAPLAKLGLHYGDTAELFFDEVRVPVENRLGDEGKAFSYLLSNLPQERLSIAVGAVAMSRAALELALSYSRSRLLFGKPLISFQNTKFVLAEVATEVEVAEQLIDRSVQELDAGTLTPSDAAMVKLFCTEAQGRAVDKCLQLHGGYGFMAEYPIASMYADARVTRIYGGSSEVMKVIISKALAAE
jgi:acyl-CoA dehydrogenase